MKYIGGNIYAVNGDTPSNYLYSWLNTYWTITKIDTLGNQIFTTDLEAHKLLNNFTVQGETLIVPAYVTADTIGVAGHGVIYLVDNNNGNVMDSISLAYDDCEIIPYLISPDRHGEYDVYAVRRNDYDNQSVSQHGSTTNEDHLLGGKLHIYHTDDLHKLQLNN